jgi:hypothetical protein
VPLVPHRYAKPQGGHDYARVPLLYYAPCQLLQGSEAKACDAVGRFSDVETLSAIEKRIRARFPGFKGQVVAYPDAEHEAKKQKEDRTLDFGLFAIAVTLAIGGALGFVKAKRSHAVG